MLANDFFDLDQRFAEWEDFRPQDFHPTTIHGITSDQDTQKPAVGYWPGKVDTYFDLYVAGVCNIHRTARLLLAMLIHLDGALENSTYVHYINTATSVVKDIFASIPYHLADNLPVFVNGVTNREEIDPGRSLGGLLLMHPLYVISKMEFLDDGMREYARHCLRWIGNEMGIGQAGLMADVSEISRHPRILHQSMLESVTNIFFRFTGRA